MSWSYRVFVRPALFSRDSEEVHDLTLSCLGWAGRHSAACEALNGFFSAPPLPIQCFGLSFPNPIGLAAGMDKHAAAVPVWEALGFGYVELGGVTWDAQPGNPKPRMFRAIPDQALINRMGFNNPGARTFNERVAGWKALGRWPRHPVGINLGKSKGTPLDKAAAEYKASFRLLREAADFFVVNVSSPNTPNLRQLQEKTALDEVLQGLQEENRRPAVAGQKERPILLKIAPEMTFEALDEALEVAVARGVAGVVATNTTLGRPDAEDPDLRRTYSEPGGLSGRPLARRSTEVIRHIHRQMRGRIPVVGVGGIFNAADAWEKITAGASLLQVYTGLVYEGPGMAREIVLGLRRRLAERAMKSLDEAVGIGKAEDC
jgi:dihydroorotate dehydrogenase